MFILGDGRRAFLDYLRNLTPQSLLVSIALVLYVQLDFRRWDLTNWLVTGAFFICGAFAFLALFANASLFLDASLESVDRFARRGPMIRRSKRSRRAAVFAMLELMRRRSPGMFIDLIVSMLLVNASWVAVAIAGFSAARSALR